MGAWGWFYTTDYGNFGPEEKDKERSPPENLTRWITTQSKVLKDRALER